MEFFVICIFIGIIAGMYLIANTCIDPPDTFKQYKTPFLISCSFLWIGFIGLTISNYFQLDGKSYTLFALPFFLILIYNTLSWFVFKCNKIWVISLIFSIIILWFLQIFVHNYYYDTDKDYAAQTEIKLQQMRERQRLRDIEKQKEQEQYEQDLEIQNNNYYINGDHNTITINNN